MNGEPPEALSPSEERLLALLLLLQADAPRPEDSITESIMRSARRQHTARRAMHALDAIFGGIIDGAGLLLGLRLRPRTPRTAG